MGNVNPSGHGINGNVYAGNVSPTLTTNKGEGPKILMQKKNLAEAIEQYGNKNSNYEPFDGAICYPMTSQDFVRTGFLKIAPTLSARDYKDPKWVIEE